MAKKFDMVVTTGTYTDKNGNKKNQYETIGAVFDGEKGMFAILKKTFNPAGVLSDRDSVMINFYEAKPFSPKDQAEEDVPF